MSKATFHCLLILACLLPGLAGGARAAPDRYTLDPVHTRILVAVDHAGFSKSLGTLSGAAGELHFDPDDWSSARIEVEIPIGRLDFGDDKWNRATLARNLLDGEGHPVARFTSTRVVATDARSAIVYGALSLRGVSREVALQVTLNAARRHPLPPFRRTLGFSAFTTLSRADFGMTAWSSVIGDTVELRIEAEASRVRGSADPLTPEDDDAGTGSPVPDDAPPILPTTDPEPTA